MMIQGRDIPDSSIRDFCRRWQIVELSLFGSVLRHDFGPASDVDVLVKFAPQAEVALLTLTRMQDELAGIFGRRVDLVEKQGIVNRFLRHDILTSRRVLYAA